MLYQHRSFVFLCSRHKIHRRHQGQRESKWQRQGYLEKSKRRVTSQAGVGALLERSNTYRQGPCYEIVMRRERGQG